MHFIVNKLIKYIDNIKLKIIYLIYWKLNSQLDNFTPKIQHYKFLNKYILSIS